MKAPVWVRYLRETGSKAQSAIGPFRFVAGIAATVGGFVLNVDLGTAVGVFVLVVFLVEWLVLTPAKLWDANKTPRPPTSIIGSVEAGGVVNVYVQGDGVGGPSATTTTPNRAVRRSRRTSKHDPPDPPPSLGL